MLKQRTLKSSFTDDIQLVLDRMPMFCSLDLLLPGLKKIPDELIDCLKKKIYFEIEDVPLDLIASGEFLGAFVNNGRLFLQSHDTQIDRDNCATMFPNGKLQLNLLTAFYRGSKFQGKISKCCYQNQKWVVELPLLELYRSGGTAYKSVLQELRKLRMNLTVLWEPPERGILSSSICDYFKSYDLKCEERKNKLYKHVYKALKIPIVDATQPEGSVKLSSLDELYEWLGAVVVGTNVSLLDGGGVSTFLMPAYEHERLDVSRRLSVTGLLTDTQIRAFLAALAGCMSEEDSELAKRPWLCLTLSGLPDCTKSWRGPDHGCLDGGHNMLTWVVFPDNKAWCVELVDSADRKLPPI